MQIRRSFIHISIFSQVPCLHKILTGAEIDDDDRKTLVALKDVLAKCLERAGKGAANTDHLVLDTAISARLFGHAEPTADERAFFEVLFSFCSSCFRFLTDRDRPKFVRLFFLSNCDCTNVADFIYLKVWKIVFGLRGVFSERSAHNSRIR